MDHFSLTLPMGVGPSHYPQLDLVYIIWVSHLYPHIILIFELFAYTIGENCPNDSLHGRDPSSPKAWLSRFLSPTLAFCATPRKGPGGEKTVKIKLVDLQRLFTSLLGFSRVPATNSYCPTESAALQRRPPMLLGSLEPSAALLHPGWRCTWQPAVAVAGQGQLSCGMTTTGGKSCRILPFFPSKLRRNPWSHEDRPSPLDRSQILGLQGRVNASIIQGSVNVDMSMPWGAFICRFISRPWRPKLLTFCISEPQRGPLWKKHLSPTHPASGRPADSPHGDSALAIKFWSTPFQPTSSHANEVCQASFLRWKTKGPCQTSSRTLLSIQTPRHKVWLWVKNWVPINRPTWREKKR